MAENIKGAAATPRPAEGAVAAKDLELSYQKHSAHSVKAKLEYEKLYQRMVEHLCADHLEPFVKTLVEAEGFVLQKEPLVQSMRQAVLARLQCAMDVFWTECDVENGLISLQILKEKFKEYEGRNWNILNKNPEERTLPMRMYFKNIFKRHLLKQLQCQDGILKDVLETNGTHRTRIQEISQERVFLKAAMESSRRHFAEAGPIMMEMTQKLLADDDCDNSRM